MKILKQKGNVLLFAIVAMTIISVLGTGIYFMTTTAIFSGLGANQQNRAYQLAVAGKDYALIKNLPNASGRNFVLANNDKFQLDISGNNIDSTGIVKEGTPFEAKRKISIIKSGFSSQADISFAKDIAAFSPGIRQSGADFVNVDTAAAQILLGQFQTSKFGSVWYSGTSALGNCQNGECDFGTGLRTYFIFKMERQNLDPQGFTFAIFNGADNSNTSAGGDYTMPELLAYAGDSCKGRASPATGPCTGGYVDPNPDVSKKGIQAPKMAIEFDGRQNCCDISSCVLGSCYPDFCHYDYSTTTIPPRINSNSRSDGLRSHMAYVFWGDNDNTGNIATCSNKEDSPTYDDNRHSAGDVSDPVNSSISSDTSETNDYFTGLAPEPDWVPGWLFDTNVYAVRVEVTRASNMNANSKYFYTINTWIRRCNSNNINDPAVCSEFGELSNTKVVYNPDPADPPTLKRTIELAQPFHDKFDKFLFGWTAAAGGQTQEKITLKNFQMYFDREPVACGGYSVWNNLGIAGSTSYFKINGTCGSTGILYGSLIGNIGPNGTMNGYTNSGCTIATSPSELTYSQAAAADADTDCAVYFNGTDK